MGTKLDVVVGVFFDKVGRVLLAQRPAGKTYAGYWELPGGKFEEGEDAPAALFRECQEELGVAVDGSMPWVVYDRARTNSDTGIQIRLWFRRVCSWQGEVKPCEKQVLQWVSPDGMMNLSPLLPSMKPVMRWLKLSPYYFISQAQVMGEQLFCEKLVGVSEQMAPKFTLQLREPLMAEHELSSFFPRVTKLARSYGALILVNSLHDEFFDELFDGVHWRALDWGGNAFSSESAQKRRRDLRERGAIQGASCHSRDDLEKAAALGMDYALLSPLLATRSHPAQVPLGWEGWGKMVSGAPLPVYGLGGLTRDDAPKLLELGGQGVAMMRAPWR